MQTVSAGNELIVSGGVLLALSLLPLAVLSMTSYLKLSVVFGILRNALGAGQLPSAGLGTVLALALTLHIMSPVFSESYQALQMSYPAMRSSKDVVAELERYKTIVGDVGAPLKRFLLSHTAARELKFFANLRTAQEATMDQTTDPSWSALIPAFIISELQSALKIGFILFIPFMIVDLVVANLLVGLGMMMVSPHTIALPLKLLLFFLCDGWFLLAKGLLQGYGVS